MSKASKNGHYPDVGKPKATEWMLESGDLVRVKPLSIKMSVAILERMREKFPFPDKAEYEVIPENAAHEGVVIPAEDNPDYQELVREIGLKQSEWRREQIRNLCVTFPEGEDVLIARHADDLAAYRQLDLGEDAIPDDDWEATLHFFVLHNGEDIANIIRASEDTLPVTQGEVTDKVRLFRPDVSQSATRAD